MRYSASGFLHKSNPYGQVTKELGQKKYLGWFGSENRHFVLFSAEGYSAKEF
jgi:hypothetical protein